MPVAVIIGGSSGVGAGLTKALSLRGYDVIIGDRIKPDFENSTYHPLDATCTNSVIKFGSWLKSKTDKIELLAITIGAIDQASIVGTPLENWNHMLQVNLVASAAMVDCLLPTLLKSDTPKIMLTSSGSGLAAPDPASKLGLYAVTKHAMIGYYLSLKGELKSEGIDVSLLIPSAVEGNLAYNSATHRKELLNEEVNSLKGAQPSNRILMDTQIAGDLFVDQWLSGLDIVTNEPEMMAQRVSQNEDWFQAMLSKTQEHKTNR